MSAAVDILSDSDADRSPTPTPTPKPSSAPSVPAPAPAPAPAPILLIDDDDPTPVRRRCTRTSSIAQSPLQSSPDVVILPPPSSSSCDARAMAAPRGSSGSSRSGMILVESDDDDGESDGGRCGGIDAMASVLSPDIGSLSDLDKNCDSELSGRRSAKYNSIGVIVSLSQSDDCHDWAVLGDNSQYDDPLGDELAIKISQDKNDERSLTQEENTRKMIRASDGNDSKAQAAARKKQMKEEKAQLVEERKRKRQEEKLEREAKKAEAQEMKKLEKEKKKWEKGKLALKSIIAEIDPKVIQDGKLGGPLLTRFAEKNFSYQITKNPIEGSIVWKMDIPDEVAQHSSVGTEVPYVVLVYQAKEFCDLVRNNLLMDHVHKVRSHEQSQYKNPSTSDSWRRPPVDEALSKLATHYSHVHSRQCIDEAELAEHIVGLTSSLASCQFRKKLTWLSVNANGSFVPKGATEKNLIKKNAWLKVLLAIPKVQPRHAIAIWKKYPTMRSLLNMYMDPTKSLDASLSSQESRLRILVEMFNKPAAVYGVILCCFRYGILDRNSQVHEKEFLLKDLMMEGILGNGERRLGEVCSKRVYRILMSQSGFMKTDDVEDGADLFG